MKRKIIAITITTILSTAAMAHNIGHKHEHVEGGWNSAAGFVSDTDINNKLWNPRGKTTEDYKKRAKIVAQMSGSDRTEADMAKDVKTIARYQDAIVINSLLPSLVGVQGGAEKHLTAALKQSKDANITLISGSVFGYPGVNDVSMEDTIERSDKVLKQMGIEKVNSVADIRKAKSENKIAAMYNTQGADFVIEDMSKVARAKQQGIQVMNFTYNNDNALAGGGQNPEENGVTDLGKEFIKNANEQGVIIDCSHSSSQTCVDAAKYSTKPIMASHSNTQGIYDIGRNVSDEAILAIGKTGGVVCTNGVGMFMNKEGKASMEAIAEHVVYTAKLIGKDKTCYGSDKVHHMEDLMVKALPFPDLYPPEKGFGAFLQSATGADIWGIVRVLEDKYNWNEQEIRGFLGENLMRVYAANWK
ncbi:membrane dipeptidase [Thalassotalea psychrophila]|uniref:Membrane dipeptidase n=1 Tax=Thalassotalea psychrophila TaxID=3065647 RepID=A0ABY9TZK7_9GAMM|nr:membrane dipeptidase [Colwelliaceae bacterium SQ149]